ncbi:hypothetical protein BGX31_010022 [Mortierella sp. GBA43]|nr:hypothetical protein BGX31_010022 [Mortierella sp. GBA43]
MARLLSIANAKRLAHTASRQAFTGFFTHSSNEAIAARYSIGRFAQQPQQPLSSRFFSSSSNSSARHGFYSSPSTPFARASTTINPSPFVQGQGIRGFSRRAWKAEHESFKQVAHDYWQSHRAAHENFHKNIHACWGRYGSSRGFHHHYHHMHRRRPMRLVFRMAVLSTLLVAVPAVIVFDAPNDTLVKVPLGVFGAGVALVLAGRLVFIALPVLAVGGAVMFWTTCTPAIGMVKDVKKLLKREEKADRYTTALGVLGSEWEIQKAQPNEWFHWTFPERGDKKQLDKIDIRMSVFDTKDHRYSKKKALELLDSCESMGSMVDVMENNCKYSKDKDKNDICGILKSLKIKHDDTQVVIQMEEDGEKVMEQKFAKKYLALGRIVDRAAKEMEATHPGLNLGEQVVLVHKNRDLKDSWGGQWSPSSGLTLRIPFNRTWVNDLSEE